jgi:ribonuclease P protein component
MKFPKERRIRKRPEFQAIQSQGRRVVTDNFVLIVARAPTVDAAPRLGITVTKRVGNSVRRNRLKRMIRAAFQLEQGVLPPGYDLVVICRKDTISLSTQDVVAQLRSSEKRLKKALTASPVLNRTNTSRGS